MCAAFRLAYLFRVSHSYTQLLDGAPPQQVGRRVCPLSQPVSGCTEGITRAGGARPLGGGDRVLVLGGTGWARGRGLCTGTCSSPTGSQVEGGTPGGYGTVLDQAEVSPDSKPSRKSARAWTNTSRMPFVSPGTRFEASDQ